MTLCMDGRWSGLHGIGRYASEVIGRMGTGYAITSTRVPAASRLDPWWLQRKLRHLDADMFFSPGFNVAASRLPQVVVIHDLIHLRIPEESSRLKTIYYERLVKPVILRTGAVVTVSDFSKSAIVEWCGIDPDAVTVAPGALSPAFLSPVPAGDDRQPHEPPFVLYVGNARPHKNVGLLLRAMDSVKGASLVCVGVEPDELRRHNPPPGLRIQLHRGLSDEALAQLYRAASCLAFPSIHEGFGLPALEALSQRTPVAYVAEAVAETVGSHCGARSFSPHDASEFADCINRAVSLKFDEDFQVAAARRVGTFDWDTTAAKIQATITQTAERHSVPLPFPAPSGE